MSLYTAGCLGLEALEILTQVSSTETVEALRSILRVDVYIIYSEYLYPVWSFFQLYNIAGTNPIAAKDELKAVGLGRTSFHLVVCQR